MQIHSSIVTSNAYENKGFDLIILAGGMASRLGKLGVDCPKSMLPVLKKPFLCWQIESFLRANTPIRRLLISVRAQDVQAFTPLKSLMPMPVILVPETVPRGTGGALFDIAQRPDISPLFFAVNGDVLFYPTPHELMASAATHGAAMQYVHVENACGLGRVTPLNGRLTTLSPASPHIQPAFINAGLYAFRHQTIKQHLPHIPKTGLYSFEHDLAPVLIQSGQMGGVLAPSPFIDIGTPANYVAADAFCRSFSAQYLSPRNDEINLATTAR